MIIGDRKPLEEIIEMISGAKRVLIAGCGTCTTISYAGGEKESAELASAIRIADKRLGIEREVHVLAHLRQCELEYINETKDAVDWSDIVVSLACGIGVQTMAYAFAGKRVVPGVNTMMLGSHSADRVFKEYCGACGDCILDETGGICPIVRCSKSMLNGPCGGSSNGKCEVSPDIDCGWQLIYDKQNELKRAEDWSVNRPPKNWKTSWHGGPRIVDKSRKSEKRE